MTIDKKRRNFLIALNIIWPLCLLAHGVILLVINKVLNPADIATNMDAVNQRFFWRAWAEKAHSLSTAVYIVGHILFLYDGYVQRIHFNFKFLLAYFSAQVGIMALCTVIPGLFDPAFWADYLFPLWSMLIYLAVFFLVSIFVALRNKQGLEKQFGVF